MKSTKLGSVRSPGAWREAPFDAACNLARALAFAVVAALDFPLNSLSLPTGIASSSASWGAC